MSSERHPNDEVVRLSDESRIRLDISRPGTERFVTLNGVPLRLVRGIVIRSHVDNDGLLGRVEVTVERISEPPRPCAGTSGVVLQHVEGTGRNLEPIRGLLVNEAEREAFAAWRRSRGA